MKFLQVSFFLGAVALAAASPIHYLYGHGDGHSDLHHYDHYNYAPAHYQYEYGVHDPHTGDIKEAKETSDGHGGVKGYYKLKEADGTIRIVHYTADKHNGFQAHVEKIGHAHHPVDYHHHDHHHEYVPVYYEHHEPLVYHHYGHEHVPQVEEYHYEPAYHHYGLPYAYGYASHYGHSAQHDFHVYHDKHHAKSHQSVTIGHHH